ncbi:hypothetical protein [Lentilactobacillus otakiensis]
MEIVSYVATINDAPFHHQTIAQDLEYHRGQQLLIHLQHWGLS